MPAKAAPVSRKIFLSRLGGRPKQPGNGDPGRLGATCGSGYLLFSYNVQCVLELVDTRAKSMLIYSNLDSFSGRTACIEGYRGHHITVQKSQVIWGMRHLPLHAYNVYISLVAEYVLRVDTLTDA